MLTLPPPGRLMLTLLLLLMFTLTLVRPHQPGPHKTQRPPQLQWTLFLQIAPTVIPTPKPITPTATGETGLRTKTTLGE